MATRRPFWKWHRWKSIGFCLWPPSTCIWSLKLKFQSKLDLHPGNLVTYRVTTNMHMKFEIDIPKQAWLMLRKPCRLQTDGRTDGRTRWIQYTPPPTSLGGGIINLVLAGNIYLIQLYMPNKPKKYRIHPKPHQWIFLSKYLHQAEDLFRVYMIKFSWHIANRFIEYC